MASPDYGFPPHLARAQETPVEALSRGIQLSMQARQMEQQAQLQREANAISAQVKLEEMAAENRRAEQRVLVDKAYNDAIVSVRQQEAETRAADLQRKMQEASSRYAIQAQAQRRIQAGEDPARVWMELGPSLSGSLAGAGPLAKALQPVKPVVPEVFDIKGDKFYRSGRDRFTWMKPQATATGIPLTNGGVQAVPVWMPGTTNIAAKGMVGVPTTRGGYTVRNLPTTDVSVARSRMQQLERAYGLYLEGQREPTSEALKKQMPAIRAEYARLKQVLSQAVGEGAPAPAPAPAPVAAQTNAAAPRMPTTNLPARVKVTSPNGEKGYVSRDQYEEAVTDGGYTPGW